MALTIFAFKICECFIVSYIVSALICSVFNPSTHFFWEIHSTLGVFQCVFFLVCGLSLSHYGIGAYSCTHTHTHTLAHEHLIELLSIPYRTITLKWIDSAHEVKMFLIAIALKPLQWLVILAFFCLRCTLPSLFIYVPYPGARILIICVVWGSWIEVRPLKFVIFLFSFWWVGDSWHSFASAQSAVRARLRWRWCLESFDLLNNIALHAKTIHCIRSFLSEAQNQ